MEPIRKGFYAAHAGRFQRMGETFSGGVGLLDLLPQRESFRLSDGAVALAPRAAGIRVWQITSGAGGHPGGDRRRMALMSTILSGGAACSSIDLAIQHSEMPQRRVLVLFNKVIDLTIRSQCQRSVLPSPPVKPGQCHGEIPHVPLHSKQWADMN